MFALTLRAFLFALLATFALPADAGKIKWFNLYEEVIEFVFVCLSEENARSLAILHAAGDVETYAIMKAAAQVLKECGPIHAPITYERPHFRRWIDGDLYTVYRARINGIPVYVPLKNFDHRAL